VSAVLKSADDTVLVSPADFAGVHVKIERVDVASLNKTLYIRELMGSEGDVYRKFRNAQDEGFRAPDVIEFLSLAICTPAGQRVFANAKEAAVLQSWPWAVLQDVFLKALALGALTPAGIEQEKKT
jgi:hypothetical protein